MKLLVESQHRGVHPAKPELNQKRVDLRAFKDRQIGRTNVGWSFSHGKTKGIVNDKGPASETPHCANEHGAANALC